MKPACLLCALVLAAALTAWPQTSAPAKKKTATPARKATAASSKTGASKASSKSAKKQAAVAVGSYRRGQQAPTSDRYREIQQALVDRGYLRNEASGSWDKQSTEALKQFQAENDLSPTGKLSSLSLIRLGLGPKRETSVPAPPEPADIPPAPDVVPLPQN